MLLKGAVNSSTSRQVKEKEELKWNITLTRVRYHTYISYAHALAISSLILKDVQQVFVELYIYEAEFLLFVVSPLAPVGA